MFWEDATGLSYYLILILILLFVLHLSWRIINTSNFESYNALDHIALNVVKPKTEWMNMGNWKKSKTDQEEIDFPTACNQLAQCLYDFANLEKEKNILDVGHGSGDSLLLLHKNFNPKTLHGVTSIPLHAKRARIRLENQIKETKSKTSISIVCKDAVEFVKESNYNQYDYILALDCAYHFKTRKDFLNYCFPILKTGGIIAMIDLISTFPYSKESNWFIENKILSKPKRNKMTIFQSFKNYLILLLTGVPSNNIISAKELKNHLLNAKFNEIEIIDISDQVFPGFSKFLKNFGLNEDFNWRKTSNLHSFSLRLFGKIVESWSIGGDNGMIRSVLVKAKKLENVEND